jgi:DNA-binding Xre family transcriptional regulator
MEKYYYKIKPEYYDKIKKDKNIKNKDFKEVVGIEPCLVSQILNGRKLNIRKTTAYAFTKFLSKDLEIKDVFDLIEKK